MTPIKHFRLHDTLNSDFFMGQQLNMTEFELLIKVIMIKTLIAPKKLHFRTLHSSKGGYHSYYTQYWMPKRNTNRWPRKSTG